MNSVFALFILLSTQSCVDRQAAVRAAAEEVALELDDQSKAMLIETPSEWVYTIFDEALGREIRNRFGLHGGLGKNDQLWEECSEMFPDTYFDQFAHQCSAVVVREIAQVLRDSVDPSIIAAMDAQIGALKDTLLPEFNYFTDRDYELVEVVGGLSRIIEESGRDIQILIDPDLLARKVEIGGGRFWQPVLRKRPRFSAENVLDVLKRIKFELSTCLRRSPDVVWIGDNCADFHGTSEAFSD